jgi:hypothetical protein
MDSPPILKWILQYEGGALPPQYDIAMGLCNVAKGMFQKPAQA